MAVNQATLTAWTRPGWDDRDNAAAAVVRQLAARAHSSVERLASNGKRPVLARRWTLDGAGRLVAHWDAEPPD